MIERRKSKGERLASFLYRFCVGPWMEKRGNREIGSMTRWAVWLFTMAYTYRLVTIDALGWPDAFVAFCVLFALPVGKALDAAPPLDVVQAVAGMFGKGGSSGPGGSWETETRTRYEPPGEAPGTLTAEELIPPLPGTQSRPEPEP